MKYAELDEQAKERARDKVREWQTQDDWWDSVYTDAIQMAGRLGISINSRTRRSSSGREYCETDISFQGFSSQGDGCCFSGTLYLDRCAIAVERIKEEAPNDEDLAAMALQAKALHELVEVERVKARLLSNDNLIIAPSWIGITGDERYWRTSASMMNDDYEFLEEPINELVSAFADWIYKQLEAEYEHLTSDEIVEEVIMSGDYDFDEDGRM